MTPAPRLPHTAPGAAEIGRRTEEFLSARARP